MDLDVSTLPDDMALLKKEILSLSEKDTYQKQEIKILKEQIRHLQSKLFGRKTEKTINRSGLKQMLLFEESEEADSDIIKEEKIEIPAHKRKKRGRRPLPDDLPRVEVVHDLTDKEKICACGCQKQKIGEETAEQLEIIPEKLQVIRHIRYKYVCKNCEGTHADEPAVSIAPVPAQIIPKSIATPSLLAHIITAKFVDSLPFYRQEKQFKRRGIDLCRGNMCNWAIQVAGMCSPLLEFLHNEILEGRVVNIDETTLKVLSGKEEQNRSKSYMWIFRGGPPDKPALIYKYHASRSGDVAVSYLNGYKGYIQTDGYSGYDIFDRIEGIEPIGCFAHARRKFKDVIKAAGKKRKKRKKGAADKALTYISKLYEIEKQAKLLRLNEDEIYALRNKKSKPVLKAFKIWLDITWNDVPPKSLLGKAIFYSRNQWHRLERYIEQGYLRPDNNLAENAIRPFVVGRKNWLFSATPNGAHASATFYSLIETAKANKIEPYAYLRFLFERIYLVKNPEDYKKLLPQYLDKNLLPTPG